jgi:hypothetical protein
MSAKLWIDFVRGIYLKEGIKIDIVHYETIFRALSDLVNIGQAKLGIRSRGDVGDITLNGVSQVAKKYPSWLKSLGFGYAKDRMLQAIANLETSIGCETEQVMYGELTPPVK